MYRKPCDLMAYVILKKAPIIISRASTLETAMGNKIFGSERPATKHHQHAGQGTEGGKEDQPHCAATGHPHTTF